ncbi:hypothetical protein GGR58DRAFT_499992 [Xylaria digitata]|nr:hypothetical protein GGR58DRAFT_499992 [Xylaria digitata]
MSGALAIWLCSGIVACLIGARLGLRKWKKLAFTTGDKWLVVVLVSNGLRVIGDHYANKYGTPLSTAVHFAIGPLAEGESRVLVLTAEDQDHLVLAGKLTIATRIAIVVVLWSLKMSVLDILGALLRKLRREQPVLRFMSAVLGLTFLASILSVFLECQQLKLNWILFPEPEKCSYNALWIITYEMCNIITDTMLFFQPILLILGEPIPKWERSRLFLVLVFGLGVILIVVEIARLVEGLPFTNMILNRIVWGSVEVTIAASVATLPTVYVLLRPEYEEWQKNNAEEIHKDSGASSAARSVARQLACDGRLSPQDVGVWDDNPDKTPTSAGMETEQNTRKSLLWSSIQSSIISSILSSVSAGESNGDNWPKPRSGLRDSFRHSGTGSRIGGADDDRHDTWVELEEVDVRSVVGEAASPEPDDAEHKNGGVFIATEINQKAHQTWEIDQRPRIVAIPRRAKLDRPLV